MQKWAFIIVPIAVIPAGEMLEWRVVVRGRSPVVHL